MRMIGIKQMKRIKERSELKIMMNKNLFFTACLFASGLLVGCSSESTGSENGGSGGGREKIEPVGFSMMTWTWELRVEKS